MSLDLGGLADAATGIIGGLVGASIQNQTQAEIKALLADRPDYEIPTSIQEQVELLRRRAQRGLPGQDLIAGQIQQGTAQGIAASREAATSAADLLGATTQLYGQQTMNMTDLGIANARARSQNELALVQGLGTLGEFQDKAWNWNEGTRWQTEMNRLQGISQSAYDLTTGGIGAATGGASDFLSSIDTGGGNTTTDYSGFIL